MKSFIIIMTFLALILSFFVMVNTGSLNQASSLGILTATVSINPLEVKVSAPKEIKVNRTFVVKASLINKGEEKIKDVEAEIYLSPGLRLIRRDEEQELGTIPSRRKKFSFWPVKGEKLGNYVIMVKASGEIKDQEIEAEDSINVEIVKEKFPWWRRPWQLLANLFERIRI